MAGSIGPTNRTASLSPDVNDPGARNVTWDELVDAYYVAGARPRPLVAPTSSRSRPASTPSTPRPRSSPSRSCSTISASGCRWSCQRDDRRPVRSDAEWPDSRGLLEQRAPCPTVRSRAQLLTRRRHASAVRRGAGAHRRRAGHRLSERRAAQRLRWLRRAATADEQGPRPDGARGRAQPRGLVLRNHARSHARDRRRGRGPAAARDPRRGAQDPLERDGATRHRSRLALRQRRRADQRHRLARLRAADQGRPHGRGGRDRAPAGRERRSDDRREHGRGAARLRGRDGALPQPDRRRAGHRQGAGDDRLVEVVGHRGRAQARPGPAGRQLASR